MAERQPKDSKVGTFKILVSNVPHDLGDSELKLMFQPFGRVVECELFSGKNFAFVYMEEEECGRAAMKELHNKNIDGRVMCVTVALNSELPRVPSINLEVKNVDVVVTATALRTLFQRFGLVLQVDIKLSTAIVTLEAIGDIRTAINEMNGFVLEGKTLEVAPAKKLNVPLANKSFPKSKPKPFRAVRPPQWGMPQRPQPQRPQPQHYEGLVSRNFRFQNNAPSPYGGGNFMRNGFGPGNRPSFRNVGPGPSLGFGNPDYNGFQEYCNGGMSSDFRDNYQPDDYYTTPAPLLDSGFDMYDQRQMSEVSPGEAYPPPPKFPRFQQPQRQPMLAQLHQLRQKSRGERGGRGRMTVGKKKVVLDAMAAGINLPKGFIPTAPRNMAMQGPGPLMQMRPAPGFSTGDAGPGESPNFLPVAEFRGYKVPIPGQNAGNQFLAPKATAPVRQSGSFYPNPFATQRPNFRGQHMAANGQMRAPLLPNPTQFHNMAYPGPEVEDFTADVVC